MNADYLVTGGAGFIGSHLVERLVHNGERVRVVDNLVTGKRENIEPFVDKIDFLMGDLADPTIAEQACEGIKIVFHEAALPSVPKSVADPVASHSCNVDATFNTLVAARKAGVKRVIYAASSSAYGETETLPKRETILPSPLSPYAVQKLMGEYYCTAFFRCYGLETLSLRYFNVFGPRQDPASQYAAAIPAFAVAILNGKPPTVYGDGEQTRDFTYIDNVVQANLLAAKAPRTQGEVINIACGQSITVNAMIEMINKLLKKKIKPKYVEKRAGDIQHSWADISLAEQVIGFRPSVSTEEGLKRTIEFLAHPRGA